ncbi:uridine kinase [Streptomyces sp. NPDC014894]|uniref:uridine kinase family protein n=1 Tax=unclassified Streptomyces TaxID=2593676 RepID=UPI0037008297
MEDLDRPARTLRALPPSCGPVRLIAVDGHAGSGKSTFAARLAAALERPAGAAPVPVLHLDDLASHDELFDWTDRMLRQVIEPLARGTAARYAPYDWVERRFTPARPLPAAPVVLVEGVGAGRRALRPYLAALLWMERDAESSWSRGRRRDGSALTAFWDGWTAAETRHFSADPSRPFADALIRERPEGYELLPGTRTNARQNQIITLGDRLSRPYRPVGNLPEEGPNSA